MSIDPEVATSQLSEQELEEQPRKKPRARKIVGKEVCGKGQVSDLSRWNCLSCMKLADGQDLVDVQISSGKIPD